jgi:hypothetical protein
MPRPRLKPTDEQRRLVKGMAAMGIRQENIARLIGIKSPKTLRKFFREELDKGETEATFNMEQAQYKLGIAGDPRAQIDWLRRHRGQIEPTAKPTSPAPFIVYQDNGVTP